MTEPGKIPADSIAVIDTSVLFAMGGPENEKYHAFQRFATRINLTVTVPEQVARELGERVPTSTPTNGIDSERRRRQVG